MSKILKELKAIWNNSERLIDAANKMLNVALYIALCLFISLIVGIIFE